MSIPVQNVFAFFGDQQCCGSRSVDFAREQYATNGRKEVFICLSCGRSYVVLVDANGAIQDGQII